MLIDQSEFVYSAIEGASVSGEFLTSADKLSFEARAKAFQQAALTSIQEAAKAWAVTDYTASQAFLLSLNKGLVKDAFLAGIIEASKRENALSLFSLLDSTSSEEVRRQFYLRCCVKLATLNGREAMKRLDALGGATLKDYLDLINSWSAHSPYRCLLFVSREMSGITQLQAYGILFKNYFLNNPTSALTQLLLIKDRALREKALKSMALVYKHKNITISKDVKTQLTEQDLKYLAQFKI